MKLLKVRSRASLAWTRTLISAREPSAMWALENVPELMVGNLSPSSPCWRIYLQSGEPGSTGAPSPSGWPIEPLDRLLGQRFLSRLDAAGAVQDFAALYMPRYGRTLNWR